MISTYVFRSGFLPRKAAIEDSEPCKIMSLEDAITVRRKNKNVMSCYEVIDNETLEAVPTDLLKPDSLAFLVNKQVYMRFYVVDIDTKPHEPWGDRESTAKSLLAYVTSDSGCSGYVTTSGLRFIYPLAVQLKRSVFKEYVTNFNKAFLSKYGEILDTVKVELDDSNPEWDRVYVLPISSHPDIPAVYSDKLFTLEELLTTEETDTDEEIERPEKPNMSLAEKTTALKPIFKHLDKVKAGLSSAIIQGEAFFSAGTRNKLTFKVVTCLFKNLRGKDTVVNPAVVYSILYQSVSKTEGKTSVEEALNETWDMCVRAYEQQRAEKVDKIEKENKHKARIKQPDYLPAVVFTDRSYYIYNPKEKTYYAPVTHEPGFMNLISTVADDLGIIFKNDNNNFISMTELVTKYGVQATEVVYKTNAEKPFFDKETKTLYVPCGRYKEVEPEYNEEVAKWLSLLADAENNPDDHEALLDWLATFFNFDSPTMAIYIQGRDGAGKGMLASALASFFGKSPITIKEAIGDFNDGLVRMPFVFIDEKAPGGGATLNADLRSLIGETNHPIRKKFHSSSTLIGCIRTLMCANDEFALPIDRNMSAKSLAATIKKIRYIHTSDEAAVYLQELGGRDYTNKTGWVVGENNSPGLIAKHISWLVKNREVNLFGKRFLVAEKRTKWHDKFGISTDSESLVNILFKALVAGSTQNFICIDEKTQTVAIHVTDFQKAIQRFTTNKVANMEPTLISAKFKELFPSYQEKRVYFDKTQKRALILSAEEIIKVGEACDVDSIDEVKKEFGMTCDS